MFDYSIQHDFFSHHFLFRLANRIALKFSNLNLFISKDQFESITSHLDVNNPYLLYSSIEPFTKKNHYNNKFIPKPLVKILYHSHLSAIQIQRKGLLALLPAFLELIQKKENIKLIITGKSGDGVKFIKDFCKKNNLKDKIEIKLDISKSDKFELMRNCDLMINVSYMEGFGNACLEAMSVGLPVAVSKYGASSELIPIKNLISMSVDPKGIREIIEWYISKTNSQKLELRSKVKKYANECFSFEAKLNNFTKIVSEL